MEWSKVTDNEHCIYQLLPLSKFYILHSVFLLCLSAFITCTRVHLFCTICSIQPSRCKICFFLFVHFSGFLFTFWFSL